MSPGNSQGLTNDPFESTAEDVSDQTGFHVREKQELFINILVSSLEVIKTIQAGTQKERGSRGDFMKIVLSFDGDWS